MKRDSGRRPDRRRKPVPRLLPSNPLERVFGSLELRVLEALWGRVGPATVRDLEPEVAGVAYTTLMTTLDRLYRKGVLDREKSGRRFEYRPRYTRDGLLSTVAGDALATILGPRASELRPMVSFFLDAVQREDREVLDALDALIRDHREPEGEK
jgi:predicted transcriptional regulator